MIPKTTSNLQVGDFCWIPTESGLYVPFVFLARLPQTRTTFYGGLANVKMVTRDVAAMPLSVAIEDYALVHIRCYHDLNAPIAGNLANHLSQEFLPKVERDVNKFQIGSSSRVWGCNALIKHANKIG